jgi:patatin-related protein
VEEAVERLFGRTLFLDRPTVKRLTTWRMKAQQAAAERAGFAWHSYAQVKFTGIVDSLGATVAAQCPGHAPEDVTRALSAHLARSGLDRIAALKGGGASEAAITFFRDHDLPYRIRRLRLLARRLTEDWQDEPGVTEAAREAARDGVYRALALYFDRESSEALGADFAELAPRVFDDPGAVLAGIAHARQLPSTDVIVDAMLAGALSQMPTPLRRKVLLTYLGFPFYDAATLPLLRGEGLTEFDPVKVDRISPDDAVSIRSGGTAASLRGVEFYNFGAFFSRAYRENDYLWGRLHGAERMVDLVASTLPASTALREGELAKFKREAFLAILEEEEGRLLAEPGLIAGLREEVLRALG